MRDYGAVSPRFWIGDTGKALRGKPEAQVLAVYLMTSPHANALGIYHCPVLYMAHETGLGIEGASKALQVLREGAFCSYEEASETVFVKRMAAFQIAESIKPSDKRATWLQREFEKLATGTLKDEFFALYAAPFGLKKDSSKDGVKAKKAEAPSKPHRSQEQEQDQEQDRIGSSEPDGSEPVSGFAIPLNDGTDWQVPLENLREWCKSFPAVDVEQELREMRVWSQANSERRKTIRGVQRFAVTWLQKAQDTPQRHRQQGGGGSDWTRTAT